MTYRHGGDVGIRTPARPEDAYRISNPDPSTAWVHLHIFASAISPIFRSKMDLEFLERKVGEKFRNYLICKC